MSDIKRDTSRFNWKKEDVIWHKSGDESTKPKPETEPMKTKDHAARFRDALRNGHSIDVAFAHSEVEEGLKAGQGKPLVKELIHDTTRDAKGPFGSDLVSDKAKRFRDALRKGMSIDAAFGYAETLEAETAGQGKPLDKRLVRNTIKSSIKQGGMPHEVLKRAMAHRIQGDERLQFQGSRDNDPDMVTGVADDDQMDLGDDPAMETSDELFSAQPNGKITRFQMGDRARRRKTLDALVGAIAAGTKVAAKGVEHAANFGAASQEQAEGLQKSVGSRDATKHYPDGSFRPGEMTPTGDTTFDSFFKGLQKRKRTRDAPYDPTDPNDPVNVQKSREQHPYANALADVVGEWLHGSGQAAGGAGKAASGVGSAIGQGAETVGKATVSGAEAVGKGAAAVGKGIGEGVGALL